jgi:molybdopterin/thiamine biosynthesis adenylyltransferase/rhodanese-related sulfurtransferase
MEPLFKAEQFDRYRRHLSLPEVGAEGQLRLLKSRVLVIGAGGLGCPVTQYLAAAGVGRLGIVDFDRVDASNLQRQILYQTADIGKLKAEVARERVQAMNPDVAVDVHAVALSSDNALGLFADYDVIIDGTDNFPTRYLSNDACVLLGKPNVHGSVYRFDGQATVFDAQRGPCYRCLYPQPPPPGSVPSCAEGGVLGVLPGLIALIQATETVKIVTGAGEPLYGRLLQYEALRMSFSEFRLKKDPQCPVCGVNPSVTELIDYEGFCGVPAVEGSSVAEVSAVDLRGMLEGEAKFLLLDVREPDEFLRARIEGSQQLPLGELEGRVAEIEEWKERPVVIHCHKGGRGAKACGLLHAKGFADVKNLSGGIDAWSLTVDASVPRYVITTGR